MGEQVPTINPPPQPQGQQDPDELSRVPQSSQNLDPRTVERRARRVGQQVARGQATRQLTGTRDGALSAQGPAARSILQGDR